MYPTQESIRYQITCSFGDVWHAPSALLAECVAAIWLGLLKFVLWHLIQTPCMATPPPACTRLKRCRPESENERELWQNWKGAWASGAKGSFAGGRLQDITCIFNYLSLIKCAAAHSWLRIVLIVISIFLIVMTILTLKREVARSSWEAGV